MTVLRRRIPTGGRSRVSVRVEDAKTGAPAALTVTEIDGSYRVEVPGGRYRVQEKWGRAFDIVVPESGGPFDIGSLAGEDPTTGVMAGEASADPPAVAQRVERASRAPEPPAVDDGSTRPPRTPRDGTSDRDDPHDSAPSQRPARIPRDGTQERAEGPWTRVHRGPRSPRDGGRSPAVTRK